MTTQNEHYSQLAPALQSTNGRDLDEEVNARTPAGASEWSEPDADDEPGLPKGYVHIRNAIRALLLADTDYEENVKL
jgi:hypothetical protein